MTKFLNLLLVVSITLMTACSATNFLNLSKRQKAGTISSPNFHQKISYQKAKTLALLPISVNGELKNFLFDTGASLSLLQRDQTKGVTGTYSGASAQKVKLGNEIVDSMRIGSLTFFQTHAVNGDMVGLKEQIDNFGGIIGQPIISKANWLIDQQAQTIEFSNDKLIGAGFQAIDIKRVDGLPTTQITLNGKTYRALIDLGSNSTFTIPEDIKLATTVLANHSFKEHKREIYSLGGLQQVTEQVGVLPSIVVGDMEFKQVKTDIRRASQIRLGMTFFKDYLLYIDNDEGNYKVRKKNP